MRSSASAPAGNDEAPVTIATFPNPYEAGLAYAALGSQKIPAVIHHDHGQYLSAGSWVQVQVAQLDSEMAMTLLEQGPLGASADADEGDDMGALRVQRRITLARWFLYAGALTFLLNGLLSPLSAVALGLAVWSKWDPPNEKGRERLLILDLDETLIFGTEESVQRPPDFRVGPFSVYVRPHLREFFELVSPRYELAMWTSSSHDYATAVWQRIKPAAVELTFLWARDRCTLRVDPEMREEVWLKPLKKVQKLGYDLSRVLVVDDSPDSEKLSSARMSRAPDGAAIGSSEGLDVVLELFDQDEPCVR